MFKHFDVPILSNEILKPKPVDVQMPPTGPAAVLDVVKAPQLPVDELEVSDVQPPSANSSRLPKRADSKPPKSRQPDVASGEVSLFATMIAAKETAQEDMARFVELASKLELDPVLFEAIKAAACEFEIVA
jgi:hypothetical protein